MTAFLALMTGLGLSGLVLVVRRGALVIFGLRSEVKQLGQYTLEEPVGWGGMGVVYRARHAMFRQPTAVKLLHPDKAGKNNLHRFEREVELTSRLGHPNTVAIYDYGRTPDGMFYYVMEYLEGLPLNRLVKMDGGQLESRVIHILMKVCGSLAEAHEEGLIHRAIKPSNIMLCKRGESADIVKVLDYGLVRASTAGIARSPPG